MRDDVDEYALMAKWLTDEMIMKFYEGRDRPHGLAKVRDKYGTRTREDSAIVPCILEYRGRPIGYVQYYPVLDGRPYEIESVKGVYGVDLFIGEPELWDKGIGTRTLSRLVDFLFTSVGASRVVIDPQVSNHRAIRCYEKCGFSKTKLLPKHELHEGEYRDSWLMMVDRESLRE